MRNSGKLAKAAIVAIGATGVLAVCGPVAQAAPAGHPAPAGGHGITSTAARTVGFSGRVIDVQAGHLKLATAGGDVTFTISNGAYFYGPLESGYQAYVAAYQENGSWVATAIFAHL